MHLEIWFRTLAVILVSFFFLQKYIGLISVSIKRHFPCRETLSTLGMSEQLLVRITK